MNAEQHLFSREEALMNIWPDRKDHPSPGRLRPARTAAIITAMAGTVLLAAACGGSPSSAGAGSSNGGGSASSASGTAYAQCMRTHGVPNFPDPGSQDNKPARVAALRQVSDSVARQASDACAHLYPTGQTSQPLTAQQQQDYLRAAACIRSHGITNFPDPTFSGGSVHFNVPSGIDTSSPQVIQAVQACRHFIPAGLPYAGTDG
jgi:hypothetical protein